MNLIGWIFFPLALLFIFITFEAADSKRRNLSVTSFLVFAACLILAILLGFSPSTNHRPMARKLLATIIRIERQDYAAYGHFGDTTDVDASSKFVASHAGPDDIWGFSVARGNLPGNLVVTVGYFGGDGNDGSMGDSYWTLIGGLSLGPKAKNTSPVQLSPAIPPKSVESR